MWKTAVVAGIILAGGDRALSDGKYVGAIVRLGQTLLLHFGF